MSEVRINNVIFKYTDSERIILDGIDLSIEPGEFVCILGQSGCGKSTLLRLLAGLETPTEGSISVDGSAIKGASLERGVVFQDYGLFPWMTAGENLTAAFRQRFRKMTKPEAKELALKMLEQVGLDTAVFDLYPKSLSGGMKQRCAIAQAFGIDPPILLMDEPFGALDAVTRAKLQDLVLDLWQKEEPKKTVFFVTHDVDEAILIANRVIVLGQSPSKVIFDRKVPEENRPTRDGMFDSPEVMELRTELIRHINQDVASRI